MTLFFFFASHFSHPFASPSPHRFVFPFCLFGRRLVKASSGGRSSSNRAYSGVAVRANNSYSMYVSIYLVFCFVTLSNPFFFSFLDVPNVSTFIQAFFFRTPESTYPISEQKKKKTTHRQRISASRYHTTLPAAVRPPLRPPHTPNPPSLSVTHCPTSPF